MSDAKLAGQLRRAVGYGVVVTILLSGAFFVFNVVIDSVISTVETVVVPCQHGGVWNGDKCDCSSSGPWVGPMCGKCGCVHGQCDQLHISAPFANSLWGCRCPDSWLGAYCDLCTSFKDDEGNCNGGCLDGYTGSKCETRCAADVDFPTVVRNAAGKYTPEVDLWIAGGTINACSGHGACENASSACLCEDFYFPSADGKSQCQRTCLADPNTGSLCYGHGACAETNNNVYCVCQEGYHLKSDCSLACPGMDIEWMKKSCSERGVCSLDGDKTVCDCTSEVYIGDACQYKCPTNENGDSGVPCNGHGVCALTTGPFVQPKCTCAEGWKGPSCECNDAQTCSGHGVCTDTGVCDCDDFFRGKRCNTCVERRYGSQCTLQCDERKAADESTPATDIGCNSRGVCVVADYARATESVMCACSRNFDFETRCKECKRFHYPKIGASGLTDPEEDAAMACQAFANRATCNQAGEPKLGFSSDASPGAPCLCDQPHVDGNSFCTKCKETFFPDGGDMSGPSVCSKRCVDSNDHPAWMDGVFTLVCRNQGVCDPTGELCVCQDGYSGKDCSVACGGGTPCSGHGQCVSNILEQFLSAEVKNSIAGGASHHCQCDPQPPIDDRERLEIFTGLEDIGGENIESTLEYMGDFCAYSCLHPGWLDSLPCHGETCTVLPILDNQGSAVLSGCTQDTDCGDWDAQAGRLVFLDGNGDEIPTSSLAPEQIELRGQISLQNRWSPRMGPFCKVPTLPLALHTSNMVCTQRVNEEGRTEATEALCETKATKFDCLSESGNCKWTDACLEGLDKFDEFSYCYELMRTERPEALRSENCTSSCGSDSLSELDWAEVCEHFTARVPAQFQSCSSNLDDLCEESAGATADATSKVQSCAGTLSPGAKNMPALDAASLCWEMSDEQDAFNSPLAFEPLLDTETARDLQARFDPALRDLGGKHECAVQTRDVHSSCTRMRNYSSLMLFDAPAPFLYSCEINGQATLGDIDLAGNDVFCGVRTTVQELSPFVLQCASDTAVALKGVTPVEAVEESLRVGCHLLAESDLHASGIFVGERDAADMCRKVLESESPDACLLVCGEDPCVNVGTSRAGVQIFQCERDDPSTVSEESCLLGTFSLTGGDGGGQYRCAVAGGLLKPESPSSFLPCEGSLVLHADRLGFGDAKTSGLDGTRDVVDETVQASSATQTIRVEFDVEIVSESRGTVNVLAQDGVLASVLLRHFGGLGWDLNGQAEDDEPCAAGEGDSCKTKVSVGVPTHVTLEINASHAAATFGDDRTVKPIAQGVGAFEGVSVTGSARVKNLFVVRGDNTETCARLYRKTGRAATWRQSLEAASAAPPTTLGYCSNMESAWATESCDVGSPAEWDAVFGAPWEEYCAYGDHLDHFLASSQSDCTTNNISRQSVVDCAPVLSTFSTVACARDAMTFDWENDYCAPLRNDTSPDILTEIGCDSQCLSELKQSDLSTFCESRVDYWVGTEARPRFPSGCAATDAAKGAWKAQDWRGWCLAKASNTAEGVCSAATCDCSSNGGFLGGDACELSCSLGSDGSVCNEASFSGVCAYPETLDSKVDAFYADESMLIVPKRASEFQGVCKCANSRALAKDGCDVSCDAEDGEPVCNQRNYTEYAETWQISACHAGGTGVCACLPPLTRQVQENVSDWRGNKATVLSFEYGGLPDTAPWAGQFRVRAAQGPESLMIRLFNYSQSTWRTARHKFEEQPTLFPCGDRQCDFSDVVLAQSLYTTSSFFGPTCSRRCPSVDTGESLVKYEGACDFADPVRADRLTLEACQNECLDEWRCNFVRFNNITSDCRLYESCAPSSGSGEDDVFWYERKLTSAPEMTPCSGRGACTMTGTCVCDSAKFLSLTDPITGKRMRVQADERSSLAEVPTTSLETTGYRNDDCSLVCPGFDPEASDMSGVCSGRGICTRSAVCQCAPGFTGQNCEYSCPSLDSVDDTTTTCSGHGTCSEARMFPVESSVEIEDVQQQYVLTEAWRKWINACKDSQDIDFLILPFGNYPGVLDQATIKGGVDCEAVPQQVVDDIKKKYTDRPVIELLAIRDFIATDMERDLDADSMEVEGRSDDQGHEREGVFRRRYWNESDTWKSQNVFVSGYKEVRVEDGSVYEMFPGFRCDGEQIGARETGLATVGECGLRCEDLDGCACFDYQEHYHSAFLGGCRLSKPGLLHGFPIHSALQIGAENGLMEKHLDGDLTPFDEFAETYVELQSDKSCRATTVNIGDNVASAEDCARVCANRYDDGCRYFTWSSEVRRCSEVKTSSSACEEGFNTDPSGFFAVSVVNQGATAPTAYHVSSSARLFPKDKARGTVSGVYYGRARAEWVIGVAQCSCSKSYGFGHWSGFACQSCSQYFGGESCTKQCPGIVAGEPCFSNGACLWGSKDGLGVPGTFYDATCLCGAPPAPKSGDLSLTGTWSVETLDLHVEATFQRLSAQTEYFEDPNNYGFSDSTCRGCVENRGGRNCASQCSWCLFSGSCQFSISDSISVPCRCSSNYYDSENGCAPHGFILNNFIIGKDVGGLSGTNRARRLEAPPGHDVATGVFYDDAVYPNVQTSLFPSRRFTAPCPNVHETNWMKDLSLVPSWACKRQGSCRNQGTRKMIANGIPPRYFPLSCLELNKGAVSEDTAWESAYRELFFTYEEKLLLNASDPAASEGLYLGEGIYATYWRYEVHNTTGEEIFKDFTLEQFISHCRQNCATQPICLGVVVKRIYGTKNAWCYLSQNTFIASPSEDFIGTEPNALFTTYQIKREYDFCRFSDPRKLVLLIKENTACSTDTEQILGGRLPSSDSLYDPDADAAQECMNRCVALHPTYNSFWTDSSDACYCNEQCLNEFLTPNTGANAYQITQRDYQWCSLGSVTYGEIDLCADVALPKQHEDATSDSGLVGIDISMGNLGARCEVDVSNDDEDSQWVARAGTDCVVENSAKIRLHDATSAMLDYANGANALVFGAYKTGEFEASVAKVAQNSFGEMRPENPCNGKTGYFWSIADKTKCEHAETRQTCDIHDWKMCSGKYLVTDVVENIVFTDTGELGVCSSSGTQKHGPRMYENSDNPGTTESEIVQACGTACVNSYRTGEPASKWGEWTGRAADDSTLLGFSVIPPSKSSAGRCYCNTQTPDNCGDRYVGHYKWYSIDITTEEGGAAGDLHSAHETRAMYPHRLVAGGVNLEVTVIDPEFAFNIQTLNTAEIDAKIQAAESSISIATNEITRLEALLTTQTTARTTASNTKATNLNTYKQYLSWHPTCRTSVHSYTDVWCTYYVFWVPVRFVCGRSPNYKTTCYEKSQVKPRRLTYEASSRAYNSRVEDVSNTNRALSTQKADKNNAVSLKANLEAEKAANSAEDSCTPTRKCDQCQGNCDSDSECRDGLECRNAAPESEEDEYYCKGDAASDTKYCMPPIKSIPYPEKFIGRCNEYITTSEECNAVVGVYGSNYGLGDTLENNDYPRGCISETVADPSSKRFWFNALTSSSRDCGFNEYTCICKVSNPTSMFTDRTYLVGYAAHAGVYTTKIVRVDPSTGSILQEYAESHNSLPSSEDAPNDSATLRSKRAESRLVQDTTTLSGYIFGSGVAGSVTREGKAPSNNNKPRGFPVSDLGECKQLCEQTAGCTAASVVKSLIDNGEVDTSKPFKCMLHTLSVPENVQCDDSSLASSITADVVLLKPERCGLCATMGMTANLLAEDGISQIRCSRQNKLDDYCEVFPTRNAEDRYEWSKRRCPPVRPGFEKMQTSIVRVGESFKLDEMSPFSTIKGHPDVQAFSQCESMCVLDGKCAAWHFTDILSPERGDESVTHVCELFSYVPPMISTASEKENVFSGRTRIGTVQRDFSQIEIFMDDGDFAGCDCNNNAESGGYDCGCKKTSFAPYKPHELDDNAWGCSNRGACGGMGYFCVCDDGYEWAWGDAESGHSEGYTCRECGAGTYKNSDTKHCTPCPLGTYQDQTGMARCTACGDQQPTTSATGAKNSDACLTCPSGRVVGSLTDKTHTNYLNLNFDSSTVLCLPCAVGKFDNGFGDAAGSAARTCQDCPPGKTTSTYGAGECDVTSITGDCDDPGMAWENPQELDPEILGGSRCMLCAQGKYRDPEKSLYCLDCPVGYGSKLGTIGCQACPSGYYSEADVTYETISTGKCDEYITTLDECEAARTALGLIDPSVNSGSNLVYARGCVSNSAGSSVFFNTNTGSSGDCGDSGYNCICKVSLPAVDLVVGSECTACGSGRYSDAGAGQGGGYTCKACGVGRYSDAGLGQTNSNVCQACAAGRYSDSGEAQTNSNVCQACAAGRYSDSGEAQTNSNACQACLAGQYQDTIGSIACTDCAAGMYEGGSGSTACKNCAVGRYEDTGGATSACKLCVVGKYQDTAGSTACKNCAVGRYEDTGGATSACKLCVVGKYQDTAGSPACKHCPGGYESIAAKDDCETCPHGYYSKPAYFEVTSGSCSAIVNAESITTYAECHAASMFFGTISSIGPSNDANTNDPRGCSSDPNAGHQYRYFHFNSNQGSSVNCGTGDDTCICKASYRGCAACVAGKYVGSAGSTSCTDCLAGKYSENTAQTSISTCELCDAGKFSASAGITTCAGCAVGKYAGSRGSVSCTVCAVGTYAGGTGTADCTLCPAGWYQDYAGQNQCARCSGGTFAASAGTAECTDCGAGRYQSEYAQTSSSSCKDCPAGWYTSDPSSPSCYDCAAGRYSNQVRQISSDACEDCAAGYYADERGSAACAACEVGKYGDTTGRSSAWDCKGCDAGRYAASTGTTSCTDCAIGRYSEYGSATCTDCAAGKYQDAAGMQMCKTCPPGYEANAAKDACEICPANTFTEPLYFEVTSGTCDEYITTHAECELVVPFYGSQMGLGSAEDATYYPRGCLSVPNDNPSSKIFYFNTLASSSRDCGYSSYSCICKSSNPVAICTDCPFGKYSDAGSSAGSSACKIPQCPAGEFYSADAGNCVDCAAGRYSGAVGQDSPLTCAACAVGKYAASPGTSSCTACAAKKYQNEEGRRSCKFCAVGRYQDNTGESYCWNCGVGKTYGFLGACEDCAAGTYQDESGTAWGRAISRLTPAGNYMNIQKTYTLIASGKYCSDYTRPAGPYSSGYAHFLDPSDPMADTDRAQECTNRCEAEGHSYFYLHVGWGGQCMCGEDSCKSSHSAWGDADTYAIEPLTQDYPVITGASRTGCPAQTYTFADFHGKSGDWWVGDGSDQRQLPLMGGFSYEEFDEYCTNVRTKPVNGPYGDYHGSAHDWYFTDTGGRHDNGNSGAKQNNIPECQGDCDSDAQCADGLVCFHRESSDGTNPLPSCDGAAQGSAADYCVSEFVLRNVDLDTCKQRCDDDEGCSAFRWKPDGDNNCQISSDGCDARQAADSTGWKSYVLKFDDYTFPCRKYNPSTGAYIGAWSTYQADDGLTYSYKCKACTPGKYQDESGGGGCYDCAAGRYSNQVGQISSDACEDCAAGYYADERGSAACAACEVGKYGDTTGRSSAWDCKGCDAGRYAASTGTTSCTDCAIGTYNGQTGQDACTDCAAGKYQDAAGSQMCKTCPPGYQTNTDKDGCNICPANTFTQPLYFEMTSGSCAEYITTQVECDAARAFFGSEVGTGSVGSDNYYPRGCISYENPDPIAKKFWFNALTSSSSSRDCGFSSYSCICKSSNPVTTCTDCPFGKYSAAGSSAGSSACKIPQCPAGGYFSATAGDCVDCAAGRYNDQVGQDSPNTCAACAVGRYSDQVGQSSSTACQACAAGKYQQYTAQVGCYNCPAGWYQDYAGQNQCAQCTGGTFAASAGIIECTDCGAGKYHAEYAQTSSSSCKNCPAGWYTSDPSSPSCYDCAAGRYSNQVGQISSSTCAACAAGYYAEERGSAACAACEVGKFLVTSGRSSAWDCKGCDAGRYAASTGTTSCTDCAIGRYSEYGSATCTDCAAGKYQDAAGMQMCKTCPPGYEANAAKDACEICPANTFTEPLYFEVTSGTCAEYITTHAECGLVVPFYGSQMGLGSPDHATYYPRGCLSVPNSDPSSKRFYFNSLAGSSRDCGFNGLSCICKNSNPVATCTDCPSGKYSEAGSSACKIPQYEYVGTGLCTSGGFGIRVYAGGNTLDNPGSPDDSNEQMECAKACLAQLPPLEYGPWETQGPALGFSVDVTDNGRCYCNHVNGGPNCAPSYDYYKMYNYI